MTHHGIDTAYSEAMSWIARFQLNGADPIEQARFDDWLRDPVNQEAYLAAERKLAALRQARGAGLLRPSRPLRAVARPARRRFWMAAAACAMLSVSGVVALRLLPDADYRTAPGEMRTVTLEDGSTVYMNGATRLAVRFSGAQRRVDLREGEALFQVAKDPDRPFRVDAGNQVVQAVGTAFDVVRGAEAVEVAVSEGVVNILPAGAATPDPTPGRPASPAPIAQLRPGQAIAFEGRLTTAVVRNVPVERIGAWRHGELIFESVPFARILEALSRHYGGKFVVEDPALARRSVSLQLNPQSRAEMIQFIEQTMSLRAQERVAGTITFIVAARRK